MHNEGWFQDSLPAAIFIVLGVLAGAVLIFLKITGFPKMVAWLLIVLAIVALIAEVLTRRSYQHERGLL